MPSTWNAGKSLTANGTAERACTFCANDTAERACTLLYALSAGTDGGPSIPLLRQLAAIYSDRSRNRSQLSSGFNSSIMVAVIGALVGFVILALFMPLFSLITALS